MTRPVLPVLRMAAVVAALAWGALVAGCASTEPGKGQEPTLASVEKNAFMQANRAAAQGLVMQVALRLAAEQPLIVATVVDINALEQSSTLGRVISEQVAGVFSQNGLRMIEMKIRENVYIKRTEGELMLTREINDVAKTHNAQAVIVGTYGVAADMVLLNLKVVQVGTNVVLGVQDYVLPLDRNVRSLLRQPPIY